nr:l-type lectin-domain containing receptor kinase s.4 [Quercus suber]
MPNVSLDKYLFDEPKEILSREQRFKIVKGVASGLLYLHEEWEQTVVHRDIKWSLGATLDVVDSRLGGEFEEVEAILVLKLGLMCSNDAPESRPTMRHVVRCLETKLALEEEDFMQSYPTTSASVGDNEDIVDVENGLTPSFSVFSEDDSR